MYVTHDQAPDSEGEGGAMAGRSRPPRRRVANAVRRERAVVRILDAAQDRIVGSGYAAATMDRIAADADVTKGAVYFYFRSKQDLLSALIERSEDTVFTPALEILDAADGTGLGRLVDYFNYLGAAGERREHLGRYLVPVTVSLQRDVVPQEAQDRVGRLYERIRQSIAQVIADGQAASEFAADLPAAEHAAMVVAMMDGMLLEWHRHGDVLDGRCFLRSGRRSLIGSLTATTRPAQPPDLPSR